MVSTVKDCMICIFCKDKPKHGWSGVLKQSCKNNPKMKKIKKTLNPAKNSVGSIVKSKDTQNSAACNVETNNEITKDTENSAASDVETKDNENMNKPKRTNSTSNPAKNTKDNENSAACNVETNNEVIAAPNDEITPPENPEKRRRGRPKGSTTTNKRGRTQNDENIVVLPLTSKTITNM